MSYEMPSVCLRAPPERASLTLEICTPLTFFVLRSPAKVSVYRLIVKAVLLVVM